MSASFPSLIALLAAGDTHGSLFFFISDADGGEGGRGGGWEGGETKGGREGGKGKNG